MDQKVVDMKGSASTTGQAYVAFSRVKRLFIKNFNPASIKVISAVVSETEQLSNKMLPPPQVPQVISLPSVGWVKIGHLNVHSYVA